ncbi:hypothetical protein [Polaromonas sp.]|uniref:hypothetical protein n=1 Tax=Polaromonas sp. TaxID=1869339 RepID=UPI003CA3F160
MILFPARRPAAAAISALLVLTAFLPLPAHAWLGALGKLGSAAGKGVAGAAGKGAATGAGAVVGAEALEGASHAAKAAKAGAAAEGGAAATSAEQLSKATGLGKAVPDDVAAMLSTPGKTLLDVPDPGTRSWLGMPSAKFSAADTDLMVRDYVSLLEGKAAAGPQVRAPTAAAKKVQPAQLPANKPASQVPWYALELVARAAHLGHRQAQLELDRLCNSTPPGKLPGAQCQKRNYLQAKKSP